MSSNTYNQRVIDDAPSPVVTEEPERDLSGLPADYDNLALDTRGAARNLCNWLTRYGHDLPAAAREDMLRILDAYLMRHLHGSNRKFWDKVLDAARR